MVQIKNIDIAVGAKILIDLKAENFHKLAGELVGWIFQKTIIISLPLYSGIRQFMEVNRYVTCRYLQEGTIYGFKSYIEGFSTVPKTLLFLSWPASWECFDLRQQIRTPCYYPATFELNGLEVQGILNDISDKGCRIFCGPSKISQFEDIENGSEHLIKFYPFGNDAWYELPVVLMNSKTDDRKITSFGFKFANLDSDLIKRIKLHVKSIQDSTS